ncbi:oligogalacturonate-specific porin KdgM family protein [Photobacterium satsumensis]|uniref:oligogalacturonate-specific porin KdgM family protein n=1 Tax=Photobacterium satsumensis TaxID=2910239 RepID=UPI003D10A0D5
MKKLVLAAVVSSLFSATVMADTQYNIQHGNDDESKFSVYHDIGLGFSGGIEFVTENNLKRHKETNMRIDYNFDVTDAWYIQPQFELTVPSGSRSRSDGQFTIDGDKVNASQRISNTAKFGLKTGYQFDNGLYTAARYRYEMAERKLNLNGTDGDGNKRKAGIKESNNIHRMDLTLGYVVADTMDLSANYIYKRGDSKFDAHGVSDKKTEHAKLEGNQSEVELKAKFIGFDSIHPYAMYTYKGDAEIKGLGKKSVDNVFSVGVSFNF